MTYKFDYRMGRTNRTFSAVANDQAEAREKFDAWRNQQPKRVHLLRAWVA